MIDVTRGSPTRPDDVRCTVSGSLDVVAAARLRRTLDALAAEGARRIAVDLRGLSFVDASGLGVLARHWTALASLIPVEVVLVGASEEFWRMVARTQREATFTRPGAGPADRPVAAPVPADGVA